MIHEEICSYEVAKLAKEKGFPQDDWSWCGDLYDDKGELCFATNSESCVAPTQSLLQRWLREEKGLHITVPFDNNEFWWQIKNLANGDSEYGEAFGFDTYELALEDAELHCLKSIIV